MPSEHGSSLNRMIPIGREGVSAGRVVAGIDGVSKMSYRAQRTQ